MPRIKSVLVTRQEIALIAVILGLACAAAFFSVKLTRPKPFMSSVVSQWQCAKTPGLTTACVEKPI